MRRCNTRSQKPKPSPRDATSPFWSQPRSQSRLCSERGIALVTLLLIAFVASMRTESTASKNFNDLIRARQLAQAAVDDAVAFLRLGTPVQTNGPPPTYNEPTTFWTAPGLALTNYAGNFGTVPLHSISPSIPATYVNVN